MLGALSAVCAVLLVDVVVRGSFVQALLIAPWLLAGLWLVYVVSFASHVATDGTGLTVQNLLRRTRVPWGRVAGIELRLQWEITLDDGTVVRALGGPASSRSRMLRGRSAGEAAAEQTGRLVDDWIAAGEAEGGAPEGPVRRDWDVAALLALLVIVVWAGCAVLVAAL